MKKLAFYIENCAEWLFFGVVFNLEKRGLKVRDERGAVSIELAIVVAILVAIAIAVGAVLYIRAQNAADSVPNAPTQSTRFPSGGG